MQFIFLFLKPANISKDIEAICWIMLHPVMHGGLSRDRSNVKALRGLAFPVWLWTQNQTERSHGPGARCDKQSCVCVADMLYQLATSVKVGPPGCFTPLFKDQADSSGGPPAVDAMGFWSGFCPEKVCWGPVLLIHWPPQIKFQSMQE